jgi:hypothetical protein
MQSIYVLAAYDRLLSIAKGVALGLVINPTGVESNKIIGVIWA